MSRAACTAKLQNKNGTETAPCLNKLFVVSKRTVLAWRVSVRNANIKTNAGSAHVFAEIVSRSITEPTPKRHFLSLRIFYSVLQLCYQIPCNKTSAISVWFRILSAAHPASSPQTRRSAPQSPPPASPRRGCSPSASGKSAAAAQRFYSGTARRSPAAR